MNVYSGFAIPAFRLHVTVRKQCTLIITEKTIKSILTFEKYSLLKYYGVEPGGGLPRGKELSPFLMSNIKPSSKQARSFKVLSIMQSRVWLSVSSSDLDTLLNIQLNIILISMSGPPKLLIL
jgi:hypothetical protein